MAMDEHTDIATDATTDATTDAAADVSEDVAALAGSDDVTRYPIAPGYRVNVRTGPGTKYGIVRTLPYGMKIPVYCQKPGSGSPARTAPRTSGTTSPTASSWRTPTSTRAATATSHRAATDRDGDGTATGTVTGASGPATARG